MSGLGVPTLDSDIVERQRNTSVVKTSRMTVGPPETLVILFLRTAEVFPQNIGGLRTRSKTVIKLAL